MKTKSSIFIYSFLVCLSAVFFTSCKKDYTCTCTANTVIAVENYSHVFKSTAESNCASFKTANDTYSGTICNLTTP